MFQIKVMSPEDFDFAVKLTDQMNWDMTNEDFQFMKQLEPKGCFVLLSNSERVGVATAMSFGKVGWFGNLIIDKYYRNKGAGSLLVKHSIQYLKSMNVETIGLYSYMDTIPFYERLGFKHDADFTVLKGKTVPTPTTGTNVREVTGQDTQSIIDLDRLCFGGDRRKLLEPLLLNSRNLGCVLIENGRLLGCSIAKVYDDTAELGPLACQQGRSETAINLLYATLSHLEGFEVSLCISQRERAVVEALKKLKFHEDFSVARMFMGPPANSRCIYAAESLERG